MTAPEVPNIAELREACRTLPVEWSGPGAALTAPVLAHPCMRGTDMATVHPRTIYCPSLDGCERLDADSWCPLMGAELLRVFAERATLAAPPADPLAAPVEGPCWVGVGSAGSNGYRQISVGRWNRRAHRLAAAAAGRRVTGAVVDHLCRNRECVNPAHLEVVTQAENIKRGSTARKTHCLYGHEFTPENTMVGPSRRSCRTCHTDRLRRIRANRKAADNG